MSSEPSARRSSDVYESLRKAIVTGKIPPNEPLIEHTLAKTFMVSRTPVRESFQRLSRDGLIVPRKRGWAVREFTRVEVQENYEVRADLEGLAARLAAVRGSPTMKARIQRIHRERLLLDSGNVNERVRSNLAFHKAIVEAAQNSKLAVLIENAETFYFNQRASSVSAEDFERAQREHGEIVDAIIRSDGDRADETMRGHILRAMTVWLATTDVV